MKFPLQLMMALLVSTAALYVSLKDKESSRAPSLASPSAQSLPAAMMRPVSSSLACSALDRCAFHFVTESMCASSPMSRKRSQIPFHTSACGLRPVEHHFRPRSRPRSAAAQSVMNVAPTACSKAQSSARMMRRWPVSPSSVVTEFCDVSSMCSDREFVEPQSFSLSKKRAHCCTDTQEEMRYEGSPVKATAYTYAKFVHLL